ncbi:YoaK family protein [Marmoricola endophyticus]|uniref:YoaK family protein n=1 Tax=Marmoricola endophyticus TaxID=2040280 RepID=UPI001E568DAB|nr:YoaK family protein [Marmoricola endophyticus]
MSRLSALSTERVHLPLMLVLTFSTGVVDAVGYLGLDRVFTGNMTGNVVVLGMALAGGADLPVLGPLLALGGFVLGAALGGRVLERAAHVWSWLTTLLLAVVGLVVLALGVVALAVGEPGDTLRLAITTLLGAAMGLQAATARVVAVKDVTTVVVTSTLTGLAADSVLGSGKGGGTGRRLAAVVLIILGALVGGLLVQLHLGAGLLLAGVLVLLVAGTGGLHARARKGEGSDQVSAR